MSGTQRSTENKSSHHPLLAADISKEDAIAAGKEAVADKLTGTIKRGFMVRKDHKY